jgi:hypothetical protein
MEQSVDRRPRDNDTLNAAVLAVRQRALQDDDLPIYDAHDIAMATAAIRRDRALGSDSTARDEMHNAPIEAHAAIAKMINLINATVTWPPQVFLNLIIMLGKPAGGERPICVLALLVAIWSKLARPFVTEWEAEHAAFWDTNIAGSSSLRAALARTLADEVCSEMQIPCGTLLRDA